MATEYSYGNNIAVKMCDAIGLDPSAIYELRMEYKRNRDGSEVLFITTDPPNAIDQGAALESLRDLWLRPNM